MTGWGVGPERERTGKGSKVTLTPQQRNQGYSSAQKPKRESFRQKQQIFDAFYHQICPWLLQFEITAYSYGKC